MHCIRVGYIRWWGEIHKCRYLSLYLGSTIYLILVCSVEDVKGRSHETAHNFTPPNSSWIFDIMRLCYPYVGVLSYRICVPYLFLVAK